MAEASGRVLRLDPHELYWGVIETTGLPPIPFGRLRPEAMRRRLAHQFDPVLPVAVEEIHAVYRATGNGRLIACGVARDRIAAAHAEGWDAVIPADIPEPARSLKERQLDPSEFNLLAAEFEPVAVRSRRTRRRDLIAASLALAGLIVTAGNLRRADAAGDAAESARAEQRALYDQALGSSGGPTPPAVRLTAELRRLSATRGETAVFDRPAAELDLQNMLVIWPRSREIRVERLFVQPDRIDISAAAGDAGAVAALVDALGEMEGWELDSERFDTDDRAGDSTIRARLGYTRTDPGDPS